MFPTINIGSLVLPTAGVVYILGAYLVLSVAARAGMLLGQNSERIYGLATTMLLAGFVGARLTFVFIFWPAYRQDLLSILWPINSGFSWWGGLLFGFAAGFFYGRYHRLRPAPTLDALAPALVAALVVVSLGDWLAGPGFGKLTAVPWGITQYGVRRHPVQVYEIIVGLLALLSWWRLRRVSLIAGQRFLLTGAIYSGGRLFVDAFRENAWVTASGFHILQVICLVLMLMSLYGLSYLAEKGLREKGSLAAEAQRAQRID